MQGFILISTLSAALFYLGSRALITRALWSRYPRRLDEFMACAACTGFWWGLLLAAGVGHELHVSYLGLDPDNVMAWFATGLASIVTTPIVAGLMQAGLDHLGVVEPPERETPKWTDIS